ncbi:hypothetical protein BGZ76_002425 [Entomortierella beljakovae]|nr:hypothetical protein BGZ76_002425 [Entomortierella beljakovae]
MCLEDLTNKLETSEITMGMFELWAVIKKKKFEPGVVKAIDPRSIHRLDLLFASISRSAKPFTHVRMLRAHAGHARLANSSKALQEAGEWFKRLRPRVNDGKWSKKQNVGFTKALKKALTEEVKKGLSKYQQADAQIARDSNATVIIISKDSDMLEYGNISTIWRPIARGRFVIYDVDEDCDHLALPSHHHLTALGIVSKNDYNWNIRGLGSASNFFIDQKYSIGHGFTVKEIVQAYLKDPRVVLRNKENIDFYVPLQVFVKMSQGPPSDGELKEHNDQIRKDFEELHAQYLALKDSYQTQQSKGRVPHSNKTFNKFRTVEHPTLLSQKRRRDNSGRFSAHQTKLNPRYKYSEVPAEPTRITSDKISRYIQLKKNKYKPTKEKDEKESIDEIEDDDEDEDEDEDSEATGAVTRNTTDRVRVKRILNKLHPTKSLVVGSLKCNVILTQKYSALSVAESSVSIVQTTGPSIQVDDPLTRVTRTGKTGYQTKPTDIVRLADYIYESYQSTLDQTVSAMAVLLLVEMARTITMHWKTHCELMIEKMKMSDSSFNEDSIPDQGLLCDSYTCVS